MVHCEISSLNSYPPINNVNSAQRTPAAQVCLSSFNAANVGSHTSVQLSKPRHNMSSGNPVVVLNKIFVLLALITNQGMKIIYPGMFLQNIRLATAPG